MNYTLLLDATQTAIVLLLDDERRATPGQWLDSSQDMIVSSDADCLRIAAMLDLDEGIDVYANQRLTCTARNMHRGWLELARDEIAPLASFAANDPAQLSMHDFARIDRIARLVADTQHGAAVRALLEGK